MRERLRIGEVARLLGVTPKTIRHYQRMELLEPPERSASGYRLYTANHLLRLLRIRRLQTLGLSLAQIKQTLGAADQQYTLRQTLTTLFEVSTRQMQTLEARRQRIVALLAETADSSLDAALDRPSELPAALQWAQAHLADHAAQTPAALWEQDARLFGLLEAFHWPDEPLLQARDAFQQLLMQEPAATPELIAIGERLAALATLPPDAPDVAQLADNLRAHPLILALQSLLPASSNDTAPFDRLMTDVLLTSLSPAQRRFLDLVREPLATEASHDK